MFFNPGSKVADAAPDVPTSRSPAAQATLRWSLRLAAFVALALVAWHAFLFAQVFRLRTHDPPTTAFMERGLARLRERDPSARLQQRWVPYGRISVELKRAVVAAEDQRFVEHAGFDFHAMGEALERNERRGNMAHGGSTITQQLAKNLFLSPRRTWLRKAEEAAITVMLETALSKRRILEIYLNVIEWGRGIYGAEAASQHYFGKPAADLDTDEAARLAAIIPSPRRYTEDPHTDYLDERTSFLVGEMGRARIP